MAEGYIDLPIVNPMLVSVAPPLLSDLNDYSTIQSFYEPNRLIAFKFATSTTNQPVTATFGFMLVYFGGANSVFIEWYCNRDGVIRSRYTQDGTAFSAWKAIS